MSTSVGFQLEGGRIPGERIETSIETTDSAGFTGTETTVISVTAPLVLGRIYRVTFDVGWDITADGVITTVIREDSVSGTRLQLRHDGIFALGTTQAARCEVEFTAVTTANKTFVGTGQVASGGGTANRNAGPDFPTYLYVDYIRD